MKKAISAVIALFLLPPIYAAPLFNNVVLGASAFSYNVKIDDSTYNLSGGALDIVYLGYEEQTGTTLRAEAAIGAVRTDGISDTTEGRIAPLVSLQAGIGYSFIRTDRNLLSLCAVAGIEYAQIESFKLHPKQSYDPLELTRDVMDASSLTMLDVGLSLSYIRRFTERISVYFDLDARKVFWGKINSDSDDKKDSGSNVKNAYAISPAIGIRWYP